MRDLFLGLGSFVGVSLKARLVLVGIGICTVFDVTANTVVISFVFVNYCPNID